MSKVRKRDCALTRVCRHHHSVDHVHHHHWRQRIYAPRVLHQGCGHLPVGQLCLCFPVRAGVCCCQLPVYGAGPQGAQAEGEGAVSGWSWSSCFSINERKQRFLFMSQTCPYKDSSLLKLQSLTESRTSACEQEIKGREDQQAKSGLTGASAAHPYGCTYSSDGLYHPLPAATTLSHVYILYYVVSFWCFKEQNYHNNSNDLFIYDHIY